LAKSKVLEQKSLPPHEERPNRGPDDGEQERHRAKLAEAENVNDIKRDGVFADYDDPQALTATQGAFGRYVEIA
jgi:hypothetical protein